MAGRKILLWWLAGMSWLLLTVCLASYALTRKTPASEFSRFVIYFMTMAMWISGSILLVVNYFGPRFG